MIPCKSLQLGYGLVGIPYASNSVVDGSIHQSQTCMDDTNLKFFALNWLLYHIRQHTQCRKPNDNWICK